VWLELGKCGPCKHKPALPSVVSKHASQQVQLHGIYFKEAGGTRRRLHLMHFNMLSFCQYAKQRKLNHMKIQKFSAQKVPNLRHFQN